MNYDNTNDDTVKPRPATSRDGKISRDANDVTEGNDRSNTSENGAKLNTATSRNNRNIGDTRIDSRNDIDDGSSNSAQRGEDNHVPGISDEETNEKWCI